MSYAIRKKRSQRDLMASNLSNEIRKVINESKCTYGEILTVLHWLAHDYEQDAKDVIIGATLVSFDEKKEVRMHVSNDASAQDN